MDDLEKSLPGAEGMVEAEEASSKKTHNEFCLNCGTQLHDKFCHHCGQKDIPRRQTLSELWENFISSFWSYEGKFFRTTKFLLLKPGFLAIEYNKGHRESYYHPARMYAFISFVFFLAFFSLPDAPDDEKEEMQKTIKKEIADEQAKKYWDPAKLDSILAQIPKGDTSKIDSIKKTKKFRKGKKEKFSITGEKYTRVGEYDSAQAKLPEDERDGWFKKRLILKTIQLNERFESSDEFGKEYGKIFMDNFSKVLFFLLPVFALVLKLLYVRRDYFYSEHLVFSIYYYNFAYLAGSLQMVINLVPALNYVSVAVGFWIFFYLLFAMKRMYGQTWKKTIAKFFLFQFMFFICACIGLVVAGIYVLMMM
ncbi:MAG: DUF3667 domain-containing protein [Cyclobacteriaceae bacterium]|nr:DUF3667 domain-containing protein [Cyclobacteriaceae bacterium]